MKNIFYTIRKSPRNVAVFIGASVILAALYYYALIQSAPFDTFIRSNSPLFVVLQVLFSIANSVIGAVSIVLLLELFQIQRKVGGTNIFQSVASLFISVATTGCYVCGSILLPGLGLAASFASLPLGGLEIKIITLLLLLYSVNDLNHKLMGTCKIYADKFLSFKFDGGVWKFNLKRIFQLKSTFVTFGLMGLIFLLPGILPKNSPIQLNDPSQYFCVGEH